MADDDDDDNDNNDNQTDPATTEVWMTTDLAKIEARMTRDLATMAVFSSEEDCSCSYSGFYRRGMGVCEEAQGSRWSGRHGRWHWGHYWGIGKRKRDYWGYY